MKHKSYPKIPAFGYDGTEDILDGWVVIEPKIDGSNVAVWCFGGEYKLARRNGWISEGDKGFTNFMDFVRTEWESNIYLNSLGQPHQPFVLFGEFSNNQNKLKYDRKVPFYLFDAAWGIMDADGDIHWDFQDRETLELIARELNWPIVPVLYEGEGAELGNPDTIIDRYMNKPSVLGGPNEEGVVVKSYGRFTRFKRNYFCKLVSTDFSERKNISSKPVRVGMGIGDWARDTFFTPARLQKAIQRLKEDGSWDEGNSRKNIGALIGTVMRDINEEHYTEIAEQAAKVAWKEVGTSISKAVAPALDNLMMEGNNGSIEEEASV